MFIVHIRNVCVCVFLLFLMANDCTSFKVLLILFLRMRLQPQLILFSDQLMGESERADGIVEKTIATIKCQRMENNFQAANKIFIIINYIRKKGVRTHELNLTEWP